ncbi:hypothetical protein TW65_04394 [Stemphylium lycopersici]|nr:hypothetical protein TW65_04394 [Stemphylium lycopersici]
MAAPILDSNCHHHTPSDTQATPFLELPAEIRNKVYDYLYQFHNPIRLHFHQDPQSERPKSIVPFTPNCRVPTSLFSTCRQINAEASSIFYSRNTFLLHRKVQVGKSVRPCFIAALLEFLAIIGSRAILLRNVVFDTFNICINACHRTYLDWRTKLFESATDIVEITRLLHTVWDHNLNFKIGLVDMRDASESRAEYWRQNPHLHCNTAVMVVIQSLLNDQLNLRRYRSLICAVAVQGDGSGGIICWGSTPRGIHNKTWPRYYPHTFTKFFASDAGGQLQHTPPSPPHLLSLPAPIWSTIMKRVVFPNEGLPINVDTGITFPLSLPQVNKKLRADLWPTSILGNRYTLTTTTKSQRSDFGAFRNLRRLLRKPIAYVRSDGSARELTLEQGQFGVDAIVLQFELDTTVKHEDLRINILPLVVETSSTMGCKRLTVRVCCRTVAEEVSLTLQELRCQVVEALGAMVGEGGGSERGWEPEIWMNGLGEVVERYAKRRPVPSPQTASTFAATPDGASTLLRIHPKDAEYRRGQGAIGSRFETTDDFFPFTCSAVHTLGYMRWVLAKYDV